MLSNGLSTSWIIDSRRHQSRILRRSQGRLWVLRVIHILKKSLKRLHPSRFFRCSGLYGLSTPWNIASSNSKKSFFSTLRLQKMRSYGLSTHSNIASSTSPNSFFKTCRRQIMSSHGHSPTKNITEATSSKSHFKCPKCRKWVRMDFRHFETWFHRLHQSRFLRRPEEDYEFSRTFAYLKHHLIDFIQIAFFDVQKAQNEFAWTLTPSQIASSTSHKSHFKTFTWHIMSSQGHCPT
jgi:hypothetical protein